jgi:hypothetical protein
MQCIFDLMHEVRRDNKLQRALRGEARAAYSRVEALQRDNARLSAQLKTVTGDRSVAQGTTISPAESTGRELGECGEGLKTPPPFWPTTGVLPFGSLARPASAALCSGEAASSLDGRSHKSDGLTGDEVETLHGQANERKQLKQCAFVRIAPFFWCSYQLAAIVWGLLWRKVCSSWLTFLSEF